MNQSELEANTCSGRRTRENACGQVTIGFGFTSDWFRKWCVLINQSRSIEQFSNEFSKVMLCFLWFSFTTLSVWLKKLATFSANKTLNQNQSWLARKRFPALNANYLYLLRFLIGSLCVLFLLWLARVITLVLVLATNENYFLHSNPL